MQRYLDQDLDEMEYKQMLGHLRSCSECTELFERLTALSHELEQLPKVTPAYNLVDAILPKLERIDAGLPADGMAAAGAAVEALPSRRKIPAAQESAGRRKRGLFSTRLIGGVVAAGLVLGFFIFDQQQQNGLLNNADGYLSPSASQGKADTSSKAASGSEASAGGAGNEAAQNKAVPQAPEASGSSGQDASAAGPSEAAKNTQAPDYAAAPTNGAGPSNAAPTDGGSVPADKKTAPGSNTEPPAASAGKTAPAPSQEPKSNSAGSAQPDPDASAPAGNAEPKTAQPPSAAVPPVSRDLTTPVIPPSGQSNPPSAAEPAPTTGALEPADKQQTAPLFSPIPGAAARKAAPEYGAMANPDASGRSLQNGDYNAAVSDGHVVITDKQGKSVFSSTHKAGDGEDIQLIEWDASNRLTYQISGPSGTAVYVIDAVKKTEVKK